MGAELSLQCLYAVISLQALRMIIKFLKNRSQQRVQCFFSRTFPAELFLAFLPGWASAGWDSNIIKTFLLRSSRGITLKWMSAFDAKRAPRSARATMG